MCFCSEDLEIERSLLVCVSFFEDFDRKLSLGNKMENFQESKQLLGHDGGVSSHREHSLGSKMFVKNVVYLC